MPQFGSLRGKMLALILTPVAAAIVLTTLFAISRASTEQRKSSFAELAQRTEVESLKVDQTVGGALDTANAAAAVIAGSDTRTSAVGGMTNLLTANSKNIMAVFSGIAPNAFDAATKGTVGADKAGNFQPSITLSKTGVEVTGSAQGQIEPAMARKQLQHVVEKPDTGADVVLPAPIEHQSSANMRFSRTAIECRGAGGGFLHRVCPEPSGAVLVAPRHVETTPSSASIAAFVCSVMPVVTRMHPGVTGSLERSLT